MAHKKDTTCLMKRLNQLWRRRRIHAFLHNGSTILLIAMALLFVVFLLDWRLRFEAPARLALLALSAGVILAAGYLIWWRRRLPYDPVSCALQVEREYPELGELLVSYVQFKSGGMENGEASPALVAAMLKQAEERSSSIPFHRMVRFTTLWKPYLAVILTAMFLIAAAMLHPGYVRTFFARLLIPFSENQYPTRTLLEQTTGGVMIRHGQPVVLRAVVAGEVPREINIRFVHQDGTVETLPVSNGQPAGQGQWVFEHEIREVQGDFQYRILAGDAASRNYQVRVIRRPEQRITAEITYPDYLGKEPAIAPIPGFDAPVGSTVKWEISLDRPVSKGRLVFDDGGTAPVSVSASGQAAVVISRPRDSFSYGFEWTDEVSGFVFEPAVWHQVRMVPDLAPRVTLEPGPAEEKATIWKAVDLAFSTVDDHELASARLVYTLAGPGRSEPTANERLIKLLDFPPSTKESTENVVWRIRDSIPDLAPGDVVTYAVEVLDRRPAPGGPGVGRSESRTITIVTQQEYIELAMARRRLLLGRMQNLLDAEIEADKVIESILKEISE